MASGYERSVSGTYTGTGAEITIGSVGFRPKRVELHSRAGDQAVWIADQMADASMFKRVAAGTGSFVTANGITAEDTGFKIGADGDLNVASEIVHWVAYC